MGEPATSFTAEDYFSLLARSGLLDEKLLESQKQRYLGENATPRAILSQMLSEHLVTTFQAKQLGERRHRGFFLTEKYKILDFLGQGGMSRVLLCEHLLLQRLVAVKILNKSLDKFPGATERFMREARASASMDHPNIARVFDVDRTGLGPAIVMEYVDGTNLHELAVKRDLLAVNRVAHFIRQAAIGLQQAHQAGLVHRDIKPANLMLDRTGTIKLLDLGLARFFDPARSDNLTQQIDASCIIGTADYIAPEQVMESSSADIRADIYSLGYTMYFLLTRVLPAGDGPVMKKLLWHQTRDPEPVRNLRPEIPEEMATVLERMIRKKPEERFQTPSEIVTALARWTKDPIPPPVDEEMPKVRGSAYRLGLCPPPDSSKLASISTSASSPKSSVQSDSLKAATGDPVIPRSDVSTASDPNAGSIIGLGQPLGSNSFMPVGSTIRSARTNDVMTASSETIAASGSSYIRSLDKSPQRNIELIQRFAIPIIACGVIFVAFLVGSWVTLWWQSFATGPAPRSTVRTQKTATNPPIPAPNSDPQTKGAVLPAKGMVLRGGGSTFMRPAMEHWANVYEAQTGVKIEYSAAGSSKGIEGLSSDFLDFGCTDVALTDEQLNEFGANAVHIPLVMGAIVPAYNLTNEAGEPVSIRFTGAVLANIYLGKIKKWNDPGIAVSNLGHELPNLDITVVYRKDKSGTTGVWTDYLSKSSSTWNSQFGTQQTLDWPIGVGAEKNDGVADAISRTVGALGYLEYSYALANSLSVGQVKNTSGTFVEPSVDSVSAAAMAVLPQIPEDLRYSLVDAPGLESYPIVGTCWAVVRTDRANDRGPELVKFLRWATTDGQFYVTNLQYGRLPDAFADRIKSLLEKVSPPK